MDLAAHCLLALLSWDRRGWLLLREPLALLRLSQETACCSQCCVSCPEGTTCFNSIWFVCCEQDNRNLKEQNDELNGQIINLSIQGAKNLFSASFSESLAAEISSVSRDEVRAMGSAYLSHIFLGWLVYLLSGNEGCCGPVCGPAHSQNPLESCRELKTTHTTV